MLGTGFTPAPRLSVAHAPTAAVVTMRMPWEPVEEDAEAADPDSEPKEVKKGIDFSGLAQLVTMGAGAPMLVRFNAHMSSAHVSLSPLILHSRSDRAT